MITSSNTSRIEFASQISRNRFRYPFGGTRQPVEPAIGSTKHAAMFSAPYRLMKRTRSSASSMPWLPSPGWKNSP